MRRKTQIFSEALEFLLPYNCMLCGGICDCRGRIGRMEDIFAKISSGRKLNICFECLSKLVPIPEEERWLSLLSEPFAGDRYPSLPLYIPFPYDGIFHYAIPKLKFGKNTDIGFLLGILLGEALKASGVTADLVVPVPLSSKRLRERGFNQASVIAKAVSEILSIPLGEDVLVRCRETRRQTELDESLRASNVDGAFAVKEIWDISGLKIILIDDVVTTGNTIHEAASALMDAGAENVLSASCAGNRLVKNAEPF